jgi:hypothetical protein
MGLFGNKSDKDGRGAAMEVESRRLVGLSAPGLAEEVMPAFGPNGIKAKSGHRQGPMEVVSWLLPDAPVKFRQPLLGPVIEALGVLEQAGLLTRGSFGSRGKASTYHASRLGEAALNEGTVRARLGVEAS